MTDNNLYPNVVLPMPPDYYADIAIEAALWLVRESRDAIANKIDFAPDPANYFSTFGRLPAIRELEDLTEEQRFDMFVDGFRSFPDGAQHAFEELLTARREALLQSFRGCWKVVADAVPFP